MLWGSEEKKRITEIAELTSEIAFEELYNISGINSIFFNTEHLDFMNTVDTSEMTFQQFRQLEHEYIGYQSLTDVPRALQYTEELKSYQVFENKPLPELLDVLRNTEGVYARCQLYGILLKREGLKYEFNGLTVEDHLKNLYHHAGCLRYWVAVRYCSSLLHHTVDSISPFITTVLVNGKQAGFGIERLHQLLVYADDVNMLGENPQTIRENAEILLEASKEIGLEVNPEKTKYMIMSRDQNIVRNGNIKIGDVSFEEVEKFKYLGATGTNINDTREGIKCRINMGNACYYSVEKLLSSSLLSKNLKVRIYKTVILPVVLYGCETWTLTLREEYRLRVFENKVLRKIFGAKRDEVTGEWRKFHNAELHALYSSPDIIRNIKSRCLRWAGHVWANPEMHIVLVGRPEGKRPLGRPRRRWEDNIKMDLRELTVGVIGHQETVFDKPMTPAEIQSVMYSTIQPYDVIQAVLQQEVVLYCGRLIATNPEMFKGILKIRVGIVNDVADPALCNCFCSWVMEAMKLYLQMTSESKSLEDHSPYQVRQLLHKVLSVREWATQENLTPLQRRRLEGCLCRVPAHFYGQVWDVMSRTPQGIRVQGSHLPQQPTLSNMTQSELNFALLVEEMLNHIQKPEYRQVVVEMLCIVSTILSRNPELTFQNQLDLDHLVTEAFHIYCKDNKLEKLDDLTPFFSTHYSMTTGYLARAVVNNVLQGGHLATGSETDDDIGQEEPCRIS
ncbi:hypothetical protein ANN_05558 [Periplaneta americana]|uniref:Phosphorylase b kinase regulatory subunit n=1 Tax=Periplaneta americana TaxID=6978 RepID=A0ABQ8TD76_PERAM|nr:hypothetical protein ANN_05558 [Periplaneta americana]